MKGPQVNEQGKPSQQHQWQPNISTLWISKKELHFKTTNHEDTLSYYTQLQGFNQPLPTIPAPVLRS